VPIATPNLILEDTRLSGSPTNIVFGDSGVFVPPSVTVDISLALDSGVTVAAFIGPPINVDISLALDSGVTVAAEVRTPVVVDMQFSLGGVTVAAAAFYDNRVTPYKDCRVASPLGSGTASEADMGTDWVTANRFDLYGGLPWEPSVRKEQYPATAHEIANSTRMDSMQPWTPADGQSNSRTAVHQPGVFFQEQRMQAWELADFRKSEWDTSTQKGIFKQIFQKSSHDTARPTVLNMGGKVGASVHFAGLTFFTGPWQVAGWPLPGTHSYPSTPQDPKWWWDANLLFEFPQDGSPNLVFGDHYVAPGTPGQSIIVPVRSVYIVLNSASLRRVDGNIYLPTFGMSLSLDASSWTWGFTATLPANALVNLEPASNGAPVEVEALINGVPYRALVEGLSRDRSFGKDSLKITGRGKTALLDAPYSVVGNFRNTTARTAQQLANDALTVNGVSMGWGVNWGLTDWSVPANVFNHQGTYISALNAIAGAAGGYVQPHATAQSVSILPRYPVAPWDWGTTSADYVLPVDVTTQEGITWATKPEYNRVFVSGQQQGILGQVTRTGTAGDVVAPMITDPLITHADAARQRGTAILADTGRIANVKLRLPVLAETGIIVPGKTVQYNDGAVTRKGVVRSVGVDVGLPEIFQSIEVETHV